MDAGLVLLSVHQIVPLYAIPCVSEAALLVLFGGYCYIAACCFGRAGVLEVQDVGMHSRLEWGFSCGWIFLFFSMYAYAVCVQCVRVCMHTCACVYVRVLACVRVHVCVVCVPCVCIYACVHALLSVCACEGEEGTTSKLISPCPAIALLRCSVLQTPPSARSWRCPFCRSAWTRAPSSLPPTRPKWRSKKSSKCSIWRCRGRTGGGGGG